MRRTRFAAGWNYSPRPWAMAILLFGLAVAGTFAYRAEAQQRAFDLAPGQLDQIMGRNMLLFAEPQTAPQAAPAAAPAPVPVQPPGPVHVIMFVDITPNNKDAGTAFCKQYAVDTRKDPGATSVQVLAQTNRPNHLVIYEVWQNEAAYERHEALAHTKDFRSKMGPIIGAPFDERPHYIVP